MAPDEHVEVGEAAQEELRAELQARAEENVTRRFATLAAEFPVHESEDDRGAGSDALELRRWVSRWMSRNLSGELPESHPLHPSNVPSDGE